MAYRIVNGESVEQAIQRIAREQIEKAAQEIDDPDLEVHEVVHQVRKRCKKIRGLLRLVRPQLEKIYSRENSWFRDSARRLSFVRDAQSIIETFDKLTHLHHEAIDDDSFSLTRQELAKRRYQIQQNRSDLQERLVDFLGRMHEGRRRVSEWRLKNDQFEAVAGGLSKTYSRARSAMKKAYSKPGTERFHEWRKRVKYHWYHLRLLRPIWDGPMKARRDEADLLSDYLGDDHDLSILRETLLMNPRRFGDDVTIQVIVGLINRRQVEIRTKADALGKRIFAENKKRFVKRLGSYWKVWRRHGEDRPVVHAPELVTN